MRPVGRRVKAAMNDTSRALWSTISVRGTVMFPADGDDADVDEWARELDAVGKDLTNMCVSTKIVAPQVTSEKTMFHHSARRASPESLLDGCPSFVDPVIIVRERRRYPYQLLAFEREVPRERRNSRQMKWSNTNGAMQSDMTETSKYMRNGIHIDVMAYVGGGSSCPCGYWVQQTANSMILTGRDHCVFAKPRPVAMHGASPHVKLL